MQFKSFMEALKGKQHKIDKNKNGKIDAHDFKLLRKEETEELEEATVKTQKYSWGTMKTVHHGSDFSIPLHPENHQAIAKLKDEQEHKFKDETGRHWTARRKGDDVHFQGANGGSSTKVPHAQMKEEVKDPTPVAPTLDRKYIKGTPEHKAYKATKKPINGMPTGKYNEDVELDEGRVKELAYDLATMKHDEFHKTYGKPKSHYAGLLNTNNTTKNTASQATKKTQQFSKESIDEKLNPSMGAGKYVKDFKKSDAPQFAGKSDEKKRTMAIAAYLQAKRDVKEEVEELDELKTSTLLRYSTKANKALIGGDRNKEEKRIQGIQRAVSKIKTRYTKEEVEELDEKSDQARKNKIMKNVMDASRGARFKAQSGTTVPDPEPQHKTAQAHNKAIGRALRQMSNEAVSPVTVKVNHALEAPHEEEWEDTGICPEHNKKDCHECGKDAMKENTGLKSYKEFIMMLEYESDKSGSYKHKGSYGSEYAKKEREKDEKGFESENEPAKRGPKMGSKRGPKTNLGSSKLHTK